MACAEQTILTNMCMVSDGKGNVLVQNRTDPVWPGIVFPGGHVELRESITDSVIREVREETGLTVLQPRLCGVKHFHLKDGTRYIVFLFQASRWTGQLQSSDEGEAFWIPRSELANVQCVENFDHMLKVFENSDVSELFYTEHEPRFS